MTAAEVKAALRNRYPGRPVGAMVGQWTCIEEWRQVDLLALNAWRKANVVGHEVKVSRSDMRTELLNPWKRRQAVAMCTQFYFAVPTDLLKPDEKKFVEPDWSDDDFQRAVCPGVSVAANRRYGGHCRKISKRDMYWHDSDIAKTAYYVTLEDPDHQYGKVVLCPTCEGKGYTDVSRVEKEAPTLWVPKDCGLITVSDNGVSRLVKKAPLNKQPMPVAQTRQQLNELVRWVSNRPDPRHV